MTDQGDALLVVWQEQWRLARQTEDQRAAMTNIILLISSVAFGFLAQRGIHRSAVAVTVPLTFLGTFGAIAAAKYYERFLYYTALGRATFARLDELYPDARLKLDSDEAKETHRALHPITRTLRLYVVWIVLHLMIAVTGVVLTVIAVNTG